MSFDHCLLGPNAGVAGCVPEDEVFACRPRANRTTAWTDIPGIGYYEHH